MSWIPCFLILVATFSALRAEHRVALVIGDDSVAPKLEKFGYRCRTSPLLSEKELTRMVEAWASNTPTRGTALLYFKGEIKEEKNELRFATSNNRSVVVTRLIESMHKRGGATNNRILIDSLKRLKLPTDLPTGCLIGYADTLQPAPQTNATLAISPPDTFKPGNKIGDEWVNSRGMVFCWCPPGTYTAGSPANTPGRYPNEEPRQVTIKDGFWIGKYELTWTQNVRRRGQVPAGRNKNEPIGDLHWDDGRRMISRTLTEEERKAGRLPDGWEYDLPTEEQWEYAARAGTSTRYYFGNDLRLLPLHANFADKSYYDSGDIFSNHAHRTLADGFAKAAPVGSFQANPWGLHDVYGNVYEWCRDYGARGGSWLTLATNCRSAYRDRYSSRDDQPYLGYRIVIQPNAPKSKPKK
ncbi:MAG: formylglycine-generating enzyme family protein [Akkermansiaceae bacterium]|jgi:formylglycine-generating enzyme required for sulfatase activity